MVIRPTGFGKTYFLCNLARNMLISGKKRVIYIYPTNIILSEVRDNYPDVYENIDMISYQAISIAFGETGSEKARTSILSKLKTCDLLLLDEVHRAGAVGFRRFWDYVEEELSNSIYIVGVTATIERTDEGASFIIDDMFKGIQTSTYDLGNALQDGVFLPPVLAKYSSTQVGNFQVAEDSGFDKASYNILKQRYTQLSPVENCRNLYLTLKSCGYNFLSSNSDDSFCRFIVFFKDTESMVELGEEVEQYFYNALNTQASIVEGTDVSVKLDVEYVISKTADNNNNNIVKDHCKHNIFNAAGTSVGTRTYRDDALYTCTVGKTLDTLEQKKPKAFTCSLVFNVDTIIMGYHIKPTSGVMIYRNCSSIISFNQMLGRCFDASAIHEPIIIDVFNNMANQLELRRKYDYKSNGGDDIDPSLLQKIIAHTSKQLESKYRQYKGNVDVQSYFNWSRVKNGKTIALVLDFYNEKQMPIYQIASILDISCTDVVKVLKSQGITIEDESNCGLQKDFAMNKYIYSEKAHKYYRTRRSRGKTLYLLLKEAESERV